MPRGRSKSRSVPKAGLFDGPAALAARVPGPLGVGPAAGTLPGAMGLHLRARFGRLRRGDKLLGMVGAGIAAVSVASAACSLNRTWVLTENGRTLWLADGCVGGGWGLGERFYSTGVYEDENGPPVYLPFCFENAVVGLPNSRMVGVPLWMFFLLGLALTTPAILHMRRMRLDQLCPTCAYDLTGITGPCPECGREKRESEA